MIPAMNKDTGLRLLPGLMLFLIVAFTILGSAVLAQENSTNTTQGQGNSTLDNSIFTGNNDSTNSTESDEEEKGEDSDEKEGKNKKGGGANSNSTGETSPSTAILTILSDPENADVRVDEKLKGKTPLLLELEEGNHTVSISFSGYVTFSTAIELEAGDNETITKVLEVQDKPEENENDTATNGTNDTGNPETEGDGEINLQKNGDRYHMFETETAVINLEFDSEKTLIWSIGNENGSKQTSGLKHRFEWTPGTLYTSNMKPVTVKAEGDGYSKSWDIDVEYVVNPFFSGPDGGGDKVGSKDTMINLFVNLNAHNFTQVTAVLYNNGKKSEYSMLKAFSDGKEVHWKKTVSGLPPGNNYIVEVIGSEKGKTTSYEFPRERAHFTEGAGFGGGSADEEEDEDDEARPYPQGGGGGAGGSLSNEGERPELVYALFKNDVVNAGKRQQIELDAVNFARGIDSVTVGIRTPEGKIIEKQLSLLLGSQEYGTWGAEFEAYAEGKYELKYVTLYDPETTVPVENVTFYASDPNLNIDRKMMIVYSVLDQSVVKNGTAVTITMDVVDSSGIESAIAHVRTSHGEKFTVPLEMKKGTPQYGTWTGTIKAEEPDTTYYIDSVELSNGKEIENRKLEDRSFYVESIPWQQRIVVEPEPERFSAAWFRNLTKLPIFPVVLGFGIMIIVALIGAVGMKLTA